MNTIIIKDNINNINELPKINDMTHLRIIHQKYIDHNILLFDNILNNIKNKKNILLELLNYKNIKDIIILCNNNLHFTNIDFVYQNNKLCEFVESTSTILLDSINYRLRCNDMRNIYKSFDNYSEPDKNIFILYSININILHLILFHNLNIDKVLIFLLYIYYIIQTNKFNNKDNKFYVNTYCLTRIIKYYCENVINTFDFNKPYIYMIIVLIMKNYF